MSESLRTVVRNLVVLAVVILPLWFLLAWLTGGDGNAQPESTRDAFASGYLFVVAPVLVAGALQQAVLLLLVRADVRNRWLARLTVAVIPLVLDLISAPLDVQFSTRFVVATVVSLLLFGFLMRLPAARHRAT